ncbi:MAG TPA: Hsp20 family protein [Bauldia sp.]|nr:Hsp20 family protein [Bauldia sp.]
MRSPELAPLWQSTIGFDHLFELFDRSFRWNDEDNYPPYDIARTGEDSYRISLALAGFASDELTVVVQQNMLTVEGRKSEKGDHQYLYRGISARPFRLVFSLADNVDVTEASFHDGLLAIDLERRLPEAMKPKRVPIASLNAEPAGRKAA